MIDFNKLPLLANERIIEYVLGNTRISAKRKLALLGVCKAWHEIVMSLLFNTVRIDEPNSGDPLKLTITNLPGIPFPHGYSNVASFNISDVFRHVKRLNIAICPNGGFENVLPMLRHFLLLDSYKLAAVNELELWSNDGLDSDYLSIGHQLQQVVDFLTRTIPTVANLSLRLYTSSMLPDSLIVPIRVGYAGPSLRNLRLNNPIDLVDYIDLKCLAVLDMDLHNDHYHILSLIEPQILRKLNIREKNSTYLWRYFVQRKHSDDKLEFRNLSDLSVRSCYYIDDSDLDGSYLSEHRRLSKEWADAIASRTIHLPTLENLDLRDCYFVDLLLSNSKLPKEIVKVSTCHWYPGTSSSYKWVLDNIPTQNVSVEFKLHIFDNTSKWRNGILDFQSNGKIRHMSIKDHLPFDTAHIHLPMLQSLFINNPYFSELVSLASKLPNLCNLTLGSFYLYSKTSNAPEDNPDFLATSICPNLVKLTVGSLPYPHDNKVYACMQRLLRSFTDLRVAIFSRGHDSLASYVTENNVKYPHFKQLSVLLLDTTLI